MSHEILQGMSAEKRHTYKIDEDLDLTSEVTYRELEGLPTRLTRRSMKEDDPNYQDISGKTPLHHLIISTQGKEEMKRSNNVTQSMHILLKGGASVNLKDNTGQNVVHLAAVEHMPSQILLSLLRKCDVSQLSVAAVHDLMSTDHLDVDMLVTLCRSDVHLLSSVETNVTAVHRMVEKHRPTDALLVHTLASERSVEFNTIKDDLLLYTCIHGSKETLQALAQLGASTTGRKTAFDLPALLLAASSANDEEAVEKVNILVANGADMHVTSSNGQNLCHIAAILCHSRLLELAIAARVDHTHRDKEGSTPLHYACAAPGNGAVISLLIDAGLDINEPNSDNLTPLNLSIKSKHVDNILPLIRAMVNIEKCGLTECSYQELQILAQPEILEASPKPLQLALMLSSFFECMAEERVRMKESYMALSVELEDAAIDMIVGLHSSQLQGLALHGGIVEMAILTRRKRFIATNAVQYEINRAWHEWQESSYKAYLRSTITFLFQTIARPFVFLVVLPLILLNIEVCGYTFSWDILRPRVAPIIRYVVEALAYMGFLILLITEAVELEFSKPHITVLEWITMVYVLALLYNEFVTFITEGFHFYFKHLGHKGNCFTIMMFIVFYIMRLIVIYGDVKSSNDILRLSSYLLAIASIMACIRILHYLRVHSLIGPIQKSYGKVLQNMTSFIVILLIYLVAFASGLVNIYAATGFAVNGTEATRTENCPAERFNSMHSAARSLFWSLFGLLEVDDLKNCTSAEEIVGKIVYGLWLLQAMIILLNMLIALVTNKFDEFQGNADIEWKFSFGTTVIDVQKSQRLPIPFNLLHLFVDVLEWLFSRDNLTKKHFDLLPARACLQHQTGRGNTSALQIDFCKKAREKKVLGQPASIGDVVEINNRLISMEASFSSVCESLNVQFTSKSSMSVLNELKQDRWGSYRKHVQNLSASSESIDEIPKRTSKRRSNFKKSLMHRLLKKTDLNPGSTGGGAKSPVSTQPCQPQPIVESQCMMSIPQLSDALTQALISLQQSVQEQRCMLLQMQSQLANVDSRLKQTENKDLEVTSQLQFEIKEDAV